MCFQRDFDKLVNSILLCSNWLENFFKTFTLLFALSSIILGYVFQLDLTEQLQAFQVLYLVNYFLISLHSWITASSLPPALDFDFNLAFLLIILFELLENHCIARLEVWSISAWEDKLRCLQLWLLLSINLDALVWGVLHRRCLCTHKLCFQLVSLSITWSWSTFLYSLIFWSSAFCDSFICYIVSLRRWVGREIKVSRFGLDGVISVSVRLVYWFATSLCTYLVPFLYP